MKNINYDNALTILEQNEVDKVINELIENFSKLEKLQKSGLITENKKILLEVGLWDKIKFGLSKLGRYKAGGKILGKAETTSDAVEKIQKMLGNTANEKIKLLDDLIKRQDATGEGRFPNNQDPDTFLNIILNIASVYDSIVASTKLNPEDKGYLPVDAANALILNLREYVKKFLDVDLKAVYSVMDSEEARFDVIEESDDLSEDRAKDVRTRLQAKGGDEKIDSERMKTLKSWRLPLALLGTGASFGALSWLIHYLFDPQTITTMTPEQITDITEKKIGDIKPGEGMTQIFNRSLGTDLSPSSPPEDVVSALSKIGNGDPKLGVDIVTQEGGIFNDPSAARETLTSIVNDPHGHGDNLKQIFRDDWAGTGREAGDTLVTHSGGNLKMLIIKSVTKWVAKKTVIGGSKWLFAAPILKTLGIGLLGAGALVKIMREKGKRQSRAKTLNDLLQSLQLVKGDKENPIVVDYSNLEKDIEDKKPVEDKKPEEEKGKSEGGFTVSSDFLQGNRNMQLAYLASNFLPEGQNLWNNLKLKEGTTIPSGFLDAALGQGKADPKKYLKAFYKLLKKNDSFTQDINIGSWLDVVRANKNLALIKWIRNTRKGVGNFIKGLIKTFPEFEIGERQKAKVSRPGQTGQAMGIAGESLNGRFNLLIEVDLGISASQAGFDKKYLMKNLPQFMEMISMMYYSVKGTKLPYNKEAVLEKCKKYGCKTGGGKKFKKTKSADYKFVESSSPLKEEINRIKKLMK